MLAINPINATVANYSQVAKHFIDHTVLANDDYVKENLAELHIYLESSEIMV